jgi:hypothetical protein
MPKQDNRDWTQTGTIAGMAEWLRGKSDAIAVVVVRRDDAVLLAHPDCTPADARDLVIERLFDLARELEFARKEKRSAAARLNLEPWRE